ncbi:MAG: 5-(carboxyamino)imidazole ribonucleotide mutase [Methanosphaera sp.]|nr:5-(carboxyamino)imidazole ribonucleotide mutase [Methanosphaera sp.]
MIILGSGSDEPIAKKTVNVLEQMEITYDLRVASAHRTHERLKDIVTNCSSEVEVFITIAGLAAHLPGVVASLTTKPVISVPAEGKIGGFDALLSSTEMDLGTPVATMGIDRGDNAAWLACQIIACNDENLRKKLKTNRAKYNAKMDSDEETLISNIAGSHYNRTQRVEQEREKVTKTLEIPSDNRVLIVSASYANMKIVHNITQTLNMLNIPNTYKVISATRDPDKLAKYISDVDDQIDIYIAVSNLSTVLSGAIVSHTTKPVIGVPCSGKMMGIKSLLSMVEMPPGVPTATMGIDAGENGALFAARILSIYDENIVNALIEYNKTLHRNNYYE